MLRTTLLLLLLATLTTVANDRPAPAPDTPGDSKAVSLFFESHCNACHSGDKPKGDIRIDKLTDDFANQAVRDRWNAVVDHLKAGTMPPKPKPRPPANDAQAAIDWITGRIVASSAAARAEHGRAVTRRLNRVEYENTVRDLLGIDVELQELLPADSSANGFDTSGEAHHTSSFLVEKYLEAADVALSKAIANGPQPPHVKKLYSLKDERHVKVTTEKVFRQLDDTLVMFSSSAWQGITVGQFYPPDRGRYRIRISASGYQSGGKPITFRVDAGPMLMGRTNHLVGYFDAPAEKPTVFEFIDHFEARSHIRILPYGLAAAQTVNKIGADTYDGPGLAVQWIEVEGPLHDTWPPESHRRIFGTMEQKPAPTYNFSKRVEVVSKSPETDAARILRDFARRAFRRSITDDEFKPILALVKSRLAQGHSFEQSVRVGLTAVMVSPSFLFLREKPGPLDEFAIAARLSYFFWSTMPDEELLSLAEKGKLSRPEELRAQVERMIKHPKAAAFVQNFVGQWLGLRGIDFTEPSYVLYPEYDAMLRVSMVREAELFFTEILQNDLSLTNFVASDFTMLNARLARHYGIPDVEGYTFRKVTLPPESHRGGVMTMAGVLKVTANGTTTSPVVRGAWVLDRILGTPPPSPPGDIPGLEPDTRGATTIREQLAKHRQIGACASCHVKIDPPGFALESFDVIGNYRENYRTTGSGKTVVVDGRRMPYHEGKKVDPSDEMPDGTKFRNVDEFKQILLKDKDQLARSLTQKLMTYATGAAPETADKPEVESIVASVRAKNYGFRTLIHEIVQSKTFRQK